MVPFPAPIEPLATRIDLVEICGRLSVDEADAFSWFLAPAGIEPIFEAADRVLLAADGQRPIGYARLRRASSFAILDDVLVDPEYRLCGVGRKLVEATLYDVGRTIPGSNLLRRVLCDVPARPRRSADDLPAQKFLSAIGFRGEHHPRNPELLRFVYPPGPRATKVRAA
jgi:GNAT superfamily N-acetyltransferase